MLRDAGRQRHRGQGRAGLPDEIDTDRDGDALAASGSTATQLMAKLAAGGIGGAIAP